MGFKKVNQFAFVLGQVAALLENEDVRMYLVVKGVKREQIYKFESIVKDMVSTFYNEEQVDGYNSDTVGNRD